MDIDKAKEVTMYYNAIKDLQDKLTKCSQFKGRGYHIYAGKNSGFESINFRDQKIFDFIIETIKLEIEHLKEKLDEL